jgi:hypothetical protein
MQTKRITKGGPLRTVGSLRAIEISAIECSLTSIQVGENQLVGSLSRPGYALC